MLRRSIGFMVTVAVICFAGYQLAWHWRSDFWPRLKDDIPQSTGLLLIALAAGAVMVWACARPSIVGSIAAFLLGGTTFAWGRSLFGAVGWSILAWMLATLIVIGGLFAFTVLDESPVSWLRRGSHVSP